MARHPVGRETAFCSWKPLLITAGAGRMEAIGSLKKEKLKESIISDVRQNRIMLEKVREFYRNSGGDVREFKKFGGDVDVGYKIEYEKKIQDVDVCFFGLATGDLNPVHFNEEVAASTRFGGRVVHGMLTTGLVSAAVARMPGIVVLLESCFRYKKPVYPGDTVKVLGEVVEKEGSRYRLDVKCIVDENVVADGHVVVLLW